MKEQHYTVKHVWSISYAWQAFWEQTQHKYYMGIIVILVDIVHNHEEEEMAFGYSNIQRGIWL